jgi:hypothetical protein
VHTRFVCYGIVELQCRLNQHVVVVVVVVVVVIIIIIIIIIINNFLSFRWF